jgi:hypothetical protein
MATLFITQARLLVSPRAPARVCLTHMARSRARPQPSREPPPVCAPPLTELTPACVIAQGMTEHYSSQK